MNNFIRYWNQNRRKIIITIAIIVFVIIIIKTVNSLLQNTKSNNNNYNIADNNKPTQSVITGATISETKTDENINVIQEFVDDCNNKQYEEAFSLLTEECKKEFDNNTNTFINNYCKNIFETKKTYNLELWLNTENSYTYKIKYYQDNLLETGGSTIEKNIEDYITIMEQNGKSKININGFITEKEINKSQIVENIEIIINNKKIYKNYETYNITIRNSSSKTILISEGKNEDICLLDKNNVEYVSFLGEIPVDNLSLKPGYEKNISIRFNKIYDIYRIIEKIEFKNIIIDKDQYEQNKSDMEKVVISIDI